MSKMPSRRMWGQRPGQLLPLNAPPIGGALGFMRYPTFCVPYRWQSQTNGMMMPLLLRIVLIWFLSEISPMFLINQILEF